MKISTISLKKKYRKKYKNWDTQMSSCNQFRTKYRENKMFIGILIIIKYIKDLLISKGREKGTED